MTVWKTAQSGIWSDASKWNAAVPNAVDAVASFSVLAPGAAIWAIDLNGSFTAGSLDLSSSTTEAYDLRNGTIVMQVSSTILDHAEITLTASAAGSEQDEPRSRADIHRTQGQKLSNDQLYQQQGNYIQQFNWRQLFYFGEQHHPAIHGYWK